MTWSTSMRSTWNKIKFMLTLIIFMKVQMMMNITIKIPKDPILKKVNLFSSLTKFRFKLNKKILVPLHAVKFV